MPRRGGRRSWPLSFLAPLIMVLLATTVLPVVFMIALALGEEDGNLGTLRLVGPQNFGTALSNPALWHSIGLVVAFLVGALALELLIGVSAALVLDRLLPGNAIVRVLLLWPAVLPPIAVALIFKFVLQGDVGLVSHYLAGIGIEQEWLTRPASAMAVIIGVDVWQYTPFVILLTLAALTGIPAEVKEAAVVDGARPMQVIRHVILPMISAATVATALLRFIDAIQVFPTIYTLTRGGPGTSTQLLTFYNYQVFFGELKFGLGAAVAVIVVAFTLLCVGSLLLIQRRTERAL